MGQYKYKAFISYRHEPFDKQVAEKLRKLLEVYHPDKNLKKSDDKIIIFRDEDELPLSNDLNQDIKEALMDSEFLIVICSPALKDSKWCTEEVRYFKELHNGSTSNIITVLISRTPQESFIRELRYSNVNGEEIEVEPLAANIVADSEKESFRKLKKEYIRILARFYNVGFDTLYQREKRRKRNRNCIFGGVLLIIAIVAIASVIAVISMTRSPFKVDIESRISGEKSWCENETVQIGDTIQYQITFVNSRGIIGKLLEKFASNNNLNIVSKDIMIRAVLPTNMEYIKGSTVLYDSNHHDGITLQEDDIVSDGINVGDYLINANSYVRFSCRVVDFSLCEGKNELVTWATATAWPDSTSNDSEKEESIHLKDSVSVFVDKVK